MAFMTTIREAIESKLDEHAGLSALIDKFLYFDSSALPEVDNAAHSVQTFLTLQPRQFSFNGYFANDTGMFTYQFMLYVARPERDMKLENVEDIIYQVLLALKTYWSAGLPSGWSNFRLLSGDYFLNESQGPKPEFDDRYQWANIMTIEVDYLLAQSDMT